ncbi:High-affinity nickel-transport protein-domain containing protein [Rhodotorula toruloides]|uniref:High-affinity nickel-transport protein-domain containing protein n=1 Tax=Rhodotorula toruloides TaxID=5286 RepID=A0A2T0A140_RHOTO|nr:High-affinity nickel-transport protein-domain containing protein [Rhodotorula toruloides]
MRDESAAAAPPLSPAASPSPPRTRRPYLPHLPRLPYRPTLLGRSVLLLAGELVANVALWVAAACTFATNETHKGVLSLCVVAWTLGLRHGLDMDHIVAIDNATRSLVAIGQTPVTVGLFFSLGHSTIVIAMTLAIIIATSAINKLPNVSSVGGLIGVSISASFLFLLAVINSVMLWQSLRVVRRRKRNQAALEAQQADALAIVPVLPSSGLPPPALASPFSADSPTDHKDAQLLADEPSPLPANQPINEKEGDLDQKAELADEEKGSHAAGELQGLPAMTCIARIGRPLFKLINRPWKMYPIGVLFGLGFDTASEMCAPPSPVRVHNSHSTGSSLLGISALASSSPHRLPSAQLILLPLLFTAGMTAVDSLDSVFMLTAYTFPQRVEGPTKEAEGGRWWDVRRWVLFERRLGEEEEQRRKEEAKERMGMLRRADQDKLLGISVALTVISIVVALLISITEFMGLALEKCASCSAAADSNPNLSGRWWRFWRAVNDNSGHLGAGVVGLFVLVFVGWGGGWWWSRRKERRRGGRAEV